MEDMAMTSLPPEIQFGIVGHMDPLDIFHLQLTCKSLHDLVEGSAELVWKHCLEQHCIRNCLFRPSYSHLNTASEYKQAATAPLRFTSAYARSVATGDVIDKVMTRIKFPAAYVADIDDVQEMHLIPGGRFLLTFKREEIGVWDIISPTRLKLVVEVPLDRFCGLEYTTVVGHDRLYIVYEVDAGMPKGYTRLGVDGSEDATTLALLELYWTANNTFETRSHGQLAIVHLPKTEIQTFSLIGSKLIVQLGSLTLVWDFRSDCYTGWKLLDISKPSEIFASEKHVIYVTKEGVHGVVYTDYSPVASGYVSLQASIRGFKIPSFSIRFAGRQPDIERDDNLPNKVLGPNICSLVDGTDDLIFDVRESLFYQQISDNKSYDSDDSTLETEFQVSFNDVEYDDDVRASLQVHRYKFKYRPENPSASSLTRVSASEHAFSESQSSFEYPPQHPAWYFTADYFQRCNGPDSTVVLWTYPYEEWSPGWEDEWSNPVFISLADGKQREKDGRVTIAPLIGMEDIEAETFVQKAALCPASAKGVVMWGADPEDQDEFSGAWKWFDLFEVV
ncbi:hypothetical protein DFP72DRAFT_1176427 [Ephemerocybe angulata]|uniref:F-box domain-containing protein n=1 Tax=Ephemerocybe angulata TaxID=980116 RepID=A0A8H6HEX0_9AGAR|nr:hypothetical protein DFP72DRAFT_1176427 [Tulosesus angulatus]